VQTLRTRSLTTHSALSSVGDDRCGYSNHNRCDTSRVTESFPGDLTSAASSIEAAAPTVADEIIALLPETSGQIGLVATLVQEGVTDRREMVDRGAAANSGAVGNLLSSIRAIQHGVIPTSPTLAVAARSSARSFLKQHRFRLSMQAVAHLELVIGQLDAVAEDRAAQAVEDQQLHRKSEELEQALDSVGGVYVYTYPHYRRYPTVEGTQRTLLKIGMTTRDAAARIREQTRQTAVPEDPVILRVYKAREKSPASIERDFHRLLNAADHVRPGQSGLNREWFETSVEFLDAIATVLGLTIDDGDASAE
jgi:hypothetical protein